jgi:hypothetical protein
VLVDPRLSLRTRLRAYLGTDLLPLLESQMSTVLESLQALAAQQTEASAAQQASFSNLHGAIQRLEQAVRNGDVSPEIQTAVDDLKRGFDTMRDTAVQADDGFEPVDAPTPGTDAPANPDVPAEPAPVDETPTVPVEGQPVTDEGTTSRKR